MESFDEVSYNIILSHQVKITIKHSALEKLNLLSNASLLINQAKLYQVTKK